MLENSLEISFLTDSDVVAPFSQAPAQELLANIVNSHEGDDDRALETDPKEDQTGALNFAQCHILD